MEADAFTSRTVINIAARTGERSLRGADLGAQARERFKLDSLDAKPAEMVSIHLDPDIIAINASWLIPFIEPSVRRLGRAEFVRRYAFYAGFDCRAALEDALDEIERTVERVRAAPVVVIPCAPRHTVTLLRSEVYGFEEHPWSPVRIGEDTNRNEVLVRSGKRVFTKLTAAEFAALMGW